MFRDCKFAAGRVLITRGAMAAIPPEEVVEAMLRHLTGDWGELDRPDWEQNVAALEQAGRLASRYLSTAGEVFWIITEWDRSATTILLPIEY